MSKHTPGPWRTTPNGVVTSDSCQIAHVGETSRPNDMVGSFERWDADARLIAAAPELLGALKEIMSGRSMDSDLREQCKSAIAKALGEKQ